MLAAALTISVVDIAVKAMAGELPTSQLVFLRTAFAVPGALLICHLQGGLKSLVTVHWGWQVYRSLLAVLMIYGFFWGLARVDLATALVLINMAPVFVAVLSAPLLGERVNRSQWVGVAVAFAGVVVVLRPDQAALNLPALVIIFAALCYALLSISNRRLAGLETPGALAFYTIPGSLVIAGGLSVSVWVEPSVNAWMLAALAGLAGGVSHFLAASAYRHAQAARIAPLDYTTILWAALAGYLIWNEVPSLALWVGGAAIVAGGWLCLRAPRAGHSSVEV